MIPISRIGIIAFLTMQQGMDQARKLVLVGLDHLVSFIPLAFLRQFQCRPVVAHDATPSIASRDRLSRKDRRNQ